MLAIRCHAQFTPSGETKKKTFDDFESTPTKVRFNAKSADSWGYWKILANGVVILRSPNGEAAISKGDSQCKLQRTVPIARLPLLLLLLQHTQSVALHHASSFGMSDWIECYGDGPRLDPAIRGANEFFLPVETELTKDPAAVRHLRLWFWTAPSCRAIRPSQHL